MLSVLMSQVVVFEIHIELSLRIELNFLVWAFICIIHYLYYLLTIYILLTMPYL